MCFNRLWISSYRDIEKLGLILLLGKYMFSKDVELRKFYRRSRTHLQINFSVWPVL